MSRKHIKNMANISFRLCGSETNTKADEQTPTIDPYFPLFSSLIHDDPFLRQPEPTHFNTPSLDHQDDDAISDSGSIILNAPDLLDQENQVSFVLDLFQQRVEQSHLLCHDFDEDDDVVCSHLVHDSLKDSDFGAIEENYEYNLELDLGLGFGLDSQENSGFQNIDANYNDNDNEVVYNDSNIIDDDDDDYFIERRVSGIESCEAESTVTIHANAIRVIGFGSDSDSDNNQNNLAIDLNSGDEYGLDVTVRNGSFGDGAGYDDDDASVTIPLCWDSLQLEDQRENIEDFEWEEVDGRVEEREDLSMFIDDDEASVSLSISPLIAPEELVNVERGGLDNLEWQVLLNANNLDHDRNSELYPGGHDDYIYTAEYETLFGQFMENENAMMGRPPAAKSVVEKLPSVVLMKRDVESNNAVCAVCKDDINVGERVKQLPCMHRYHGECIVPWLGIRNTCPVCRYELPTDDADYERRKVAERPASAGHHL
ncbi:hypothetical protein SADUNF_Sadunf12G0049500 [Salix dunnii]|uniref:RING-type E3 ubiquitin transferase n=1 Tax=Salix dunnii TaxID=1413687 RepID=A0A835JQZ7_9ROSI|nr:hypothetical protein SADUNF_Sadunf12G0049500 [Salix dunnii]